MTRILFLGGPAGVGKSTFASTFLNTQGWGHIEFDCYSGGGVDANLRPSWNAYYDHFQPVQLWKELCRQHGASENVVVSVPGTCRWNSGVREVEFRWNSGVRASFRGRNSGIPVSEQWNSGVRASFRGWNSGVRRNSGVREKEFRCQSIFSFRNSGVRASFREADDHDGAAHGRCR